MSGLTLVLLGAGGQLGRTLQKHWQASVADTGITLHAFDHATLDITSYKSIHEALAGIRPTWIVNCAAYTKVDQAESEQDQAYRVNGQGVENIARWVAESGSRLLHVSTDFVFSGNAGLPYLPASEPDPLSVYGASKLQGERSVIRQLGNRGLILRTSWVYSSVGQNFLLTMLRLMSEREQLNVVADQIGTPTATNSLAMLITRMVKGDRGGIFHWSDAGVASWYDFAVAIQEEALNLKLLDREIPINAITTAQYPLAARRPAYSVLDKTSTCVEFHCQPLHWRRQLRKVLAEIKAMDSL